MKALEAMKTPLEWVLYGPASIHMLETLFSQDDTTSALHVSVHDLPDGPLLLDLSDYKTDCGLDTRNSHEDIVSYARLKKEAKLLEGHVQLPLLWCDEIVTLPDNRKVIKNRLSFLKRRLLKNPELYYRYIESIESYTKKGYAQPISPDEERHSELSWYLSHQSVVNPKKPGKLRIDYDCCAQGKGTSLNMSLMRGPDLMNSLKEN